MRVLFKITAIVLVAAPITGANCGSIDIRWDDVGTSSDLLCDYCKDFTDAAVASEPVNTAYQVGIGYSQEKHATASTSACAGGAKSSCAAAENIAASSQ
jgi:hypothetical protein